jgi:hypothetical protein
MCFERLSEFEETDTRAVETTGEDGLERPETWHEPAEEPEKAPERDKEYAHA